MEQPSTLSPLALFKRVIITALAATAPGGAGQSVAAARRDACPRWPQKDLLVPVAVDRCDAGFDASAVLLERLNEKGGMKKVLKDVARIDRSQCFPDKVMFLSYFMLKYTYKLYPQPWQPEYWQSERRARVFGDDTLVMPTTFTMNAARLDRHLSQRTRSIWAHHRIAFCATRHTSASQYQFTAWAGSSDANSKFIAFLEGSRASFAPKLSFNGAWHIGGEVMSNQTVSLWGMEDPRLVAASILSEYHYSPFALSVDQINTVVRDFIQQDEPSLTRWQAAFGGITQPYDHPLKAFLLLDHAAQVRGTQAFVEQTALSLESDDPKAAKAMRCLFDLDVPRGHEQWWKRHRLMMDAPRTRAWARHIHQVIEQHPETPLLVISGAMHLAELRGILAKSKASLWDDESLREPSTPVVDNEFK